MAVVGTLLDREIALDLDAASVSVLDCGGRENLPDYIRLLDALAIETFVLVDGDATKAQDNEAVAEQVAAVKGAADGAARLFFFDEDLESALGTEKRGRGNLQHVVGVAEGLDLEQLPEGHEVRRLLACLSGFLLPAVTAVTPGVGGDAS